MTSQEKQPCVSDRTDFQTLFTDISLSRANLQIPSLDGVSLGIRQKRDASGTETPLSYGLTLPKTQGAPFIIPCDWWPKYLIPQHVCTED